MFVDRGSREKAFLTSQHYEFELDQNSRARYHLTFNDALGALPGPGLYTMTLSADMGLGTERFTNLFEGLIRIPSSSVSEPDIFARIGSWLFPGIGGIVAFVLVANVLLVIVSVASRKARGIVLHDAFARLFGLTKLGRFFIMELIIIFVSPVRYGLVRDYKRALTTRMAGCPGWNPDVRYIPPDIEIEGIEEVRCEDSDSSTEKPNGSCNATKWRNVLRKIVATNESTVWFVSGRSGLGKTALLENWLSAAAESDLTPFLVRLGTGQSANRQITSLLNQFGHVPWSSTRSRDVEKVSDLISQGRFFAFAGWTQ